MKASIFGQGYSNKVDKASEPPTNEDHNRTSDDKCGRTDSVPFVDVKKCTSFALSCKLHRSRCLSLEQLEPRSTVRLPFVFIVQLPNRCVSFGNFVFLC